MTWKNNRVYTGLNKVGKNGTFLPTLSMTQRGYKMEHFVSSFWFKMGHFKSSPVNDPEGFKWDFVPFEFFVGLKMTSHITKI